MVLLSGMEQESCLCQGRAGHGFWQKKRAGEDDGWDQQAAVVAAERIVLRAV